jgi:hypothetical protein
VARESDSGSNYSGAMSTPKNQPKQKLFPVKLPPAKPPLKMAKSILKPRRRGNQSR